MNERRVAENFAPGEFILEELESRGWTQTDLVEITGCDYRTINELVKGKRSVTPDTAIALGEAFGTGAQYWLNLESSYRLWLTQNKRESGSNLVSRKAILYKNAPVREMLKRGWIEPTDSIEVLERQVLNFLEVPKIDAQPQCWPVAARKVDPDQALSHLQMAWLMRGKHLAKALQVEEYSKQSLNRALDELRTLLASPEEIRKVPQILARSGIRLVVIEPFPGGKIDGATLWLNAQSPVIALSLRFDRIDYFWHTLMHEIGHVHNLDGLKNPNQPVSVDGYSGASKSVSETAADQFATEFLVPQKPLDDFIGRVAPLYSELKLRGFANLHHVHIGLVVGQLQHRSEIGFHALRNSLVQVRQYVTSAALTDGWGSVAPALR